jgi:hypothetical protein
MRGPNWTKEEDLYLEEKWGIASVPAIANKLGRTIYAVTNRVSRLGLSSYLESGSYITLNTLFKELGIGQSYTGYKKKWLAAGCPIKNKKIKTSNFRVIEIDAFWKWAEKNKQLVNFKDLEENSLGKEPDWVKEKRAIDIQKNVKKTIWTKEEDDLLKQLLRTFRYDYTGLANRLNRSESSIKRRIATLGLKELPLKKECRAWTDSESKKLIQMYDAGYSYDQIGQVLGRSALATRGKHEREVN